MSVASDFKLGKEVSALTSAGNAFGLDLGGQVEDFLQKTEDKVAEFAVDLEDKMKWSAPVWSGNLTDSIEINEDGFPLKVFVGTNQEKITARAGQPVGPDITGRNRGDRGYIFKNWDYTAYVNYHGGTDVPGDTESSTSNIGTGGPWLDVAWLEHAKILSQKKFGSSKGVKLIEVNRDGP